MISGILAILGGLFQTMGSWMTQRANPKAVETRVMDEEAKELDEVHQHIKDRDINALRRDISK